MRAAGVTTMLALARANVSPWLVLWWVLCAVWLLVAAVYVAKCVHRWWRGTLPRSVPAPAVLLMGSAAGLLVWGVAADWTVALV